MKRFIKSASSLYDTGYNIKGPSGTLYSVRLKNADDPTFLLAQITPVMDKEDSYMWVKVNYGDVKFIDQGWVVDRKKLTPFNPHLESPEVYVESIIDSILDEFDYMVQEHEEIASSTSSTSITINPDLTPIDGLIDYLDDVEGSVFDPGFTAAERRWLEPDEPSGRELEDEQGSLYIVIENCPITVKSESSWDFDNTDWVEDQEYEDQGEDRYQLKLDTPKKVVNKVKELVTPEIPVVPGKYILDVELDLVYDIYNVWVDTEYYGPTADDVEYTYYTDSAYAEFNRNDSSIYSMNIRDAK